MKNSLLTIATSTFFVFSYCTFAASPISIMFISEGTASNNQKFANYIVKCSNGAKQPMTAWNKRKKWCVGNESVDNCHKKQIKAAKKACKA